MYNASHEEQVFELPQEQWTRYGVTGPFGVLGKGFAVASLQPAERTEGGFDMVGIRERLRLLGGDIEIQSTPGRGTRANLLAPLRP